MIFNSSLQNKDGLINLSNQKFHFWQENDCFQNDASSFMVEKMKQSRQKLNNNEESLETGTANRQSGKRKPSHSMQELSISLEKLNKIQKNRINLNYNKNKNNGESSRTQIQINYQISQKSQSLHENLQENLEYEIKDQEISTAYQSRVPSRAQGAENTFNTDKYSFSKSSLLSTNNQVYNVPINSDRIRYQSEAFINNQGKLLEQEVNQFLLNKRDHPNVSQEDNSSNNQFQKKKSIDFMKTSQIQGDNQGLSLYSDHYKTKSTINQQQLETLEKIQLHQRELQQKQTIATQVAVLSFKEFFDFYIDGQHPYNIEPPQNSKFQSNLLNQQKQSNQQLQFPPEISEDKKESVNKSKQDAVSFNLSLSGDENSDGINSSPNDKLLIRSSNLLPTQSQFTGTNDYKFYSQSNFNHYHRNKNLMYSSSSQTNNSKAQQSVQSPPLTQNQSNNVNDSPNTQIPEVQFTQINKKRLAEFYQNSVEGKPKFQFKIIKKQDMQKSQSIIRGNSQQREMHLNERKEIDLSGIQSYDKRERISSFSPIKDKSTDHSQIFKKAEFSESDFIRDMKKIISKNISSVLDFSKQSLNNKKNEINLRYKEDIDQIQQIDRSHIIKCFKINQKLFKKTPGKNDQELKPLFSERQPQQLNDDQIYKSYTYRQ